MLVSLWSTFRANVATYIIRHLFIDSLCVRQCNNLYTHILLQLAVRATTGGLRVKNTQVPRAVFDGRGVGVGVGGRGWLACTFFAAASLRTETLLTRCMNALGE